MRSLTPIGTPVLAAPLGSCTTHVAPGLLAGLATAADAESNLGAELRRAIGPDGIQDRERLSLTLLGAMTAARRAGCRPEQIRHFVDGFVRGGMPAASSPTVEERCAERAIALVDAVPLLFGGDRRTPPTSCS
jgi:hypothetical protein